MDAIKEKRIMNVPVDYEWEDKDVIEEYKKYGDKKIVSRMYDISVKEVTEILKRGVKNGI